jgi:phosphomannomutase
MTYTFAPKILRAYDIRGIVGVDLNPIDAYWIGRGFGHSLREKGGLKVCVGRDGRLTSPELATKLIEGLLESGCEVFDIGLGPSPMVYFGEYHLNTDAAVMVTGSHNPSEYNGFKMTISKSSFYMQYIQDMAKAVASGELLTGEGIYHDTPIIDDYVNRIAEGFPADFGLKVVWDPGNGAGAEIVSSLLTKISGEHHIINGTVDGTFPAHHPDPTVPENLVQLQEEVKKQRADIGVAFDGDGDRIGAVDAQGRIFWGDQLLMLLARDVLKTSPGATIIADVKASNALFEDVRQKNGEPLMWKTGHSHIKTKMKETGALLAGEMSGHIFIADGYYGFDDGIYSALRVLKMIWQSGQKPAELYDDLPQTYATPEIRLDCDGTRKFQVVEDIADRLKTEGKPYTDIDGVRANLPQGWWLMRASNTQDGVVVRCEGGSQTQLDEVIEDLVQRMQSCGFGIEDIQTIEQYKTAFTKAS